MHIFAHLSKIFSSYKLKLCTHWTKTFLFARPHPENKCSSCCCWLATQLYLTLCDPMDCRCLASLSFTIFQSLLKPMSISWWCHLTISSSVFPFSCLQSFPASGSFPVSHIRWLKCWSFNFSISPSGEYSGLISFRRDWLDLLAVQGTLKNLLQHHS